MLLLDAAFRLVSRSLASGGGVRWGAATDAARTTELRRQFASGDYAGALERAHQLEGAAVELATANRRRIVEPLTPQALAVRCPGFSRLSYEWAIDDAVALIGVEPAGLPVALPTASPRDGS
jgi:hypothetical protein